MWCCTLHCSSKCWLYLGGLWLGVGNPLNCHRTRKSLSPVSCSHKQSHEVQELTKHPIKKNHLSSTCTKIFPSTREYSWDPQHTGQWERNKRDKVLQAALAIAKHFTGCNPHMIGTLTWRKTLLTPHFAIVATMNMWDDAPSRYTPDFEARWGNTSTMSSASWHQCTGTGKYKVT